ncbi:UNVERIFIED_CONTAM: hypothetical protein K2H54_065696 [Gekko kuhli]
MENYRTTLNKSNRPVRWSWVAKEPMECMLYAVRIRSLVISEDVPVSESWSDWTQLKKVKGMDIEDSKSYISPSDQVVEEGSNISFCCVGKKGERISSLHFGGVIVTCEGSDRLLTTVFVTRKWKMLWINATKN